jgi:hypothetical protein
MRAQTRLQQLDLEQLRNRLPRALSERLGVGWQDGDRITIVIFPSGGHQAAELVYPASAWLSDALVLRIVFDMP